MGDFGSTNALAVIPARGGSKRLPRKNIRLLAGHPMIAYTIMAAQGATALTDFAVSSEDDEILDVAGEYGVENIIKRPASLATDDVRNIDVVMHALKVMEQKRQFEYDIVLLLQPTAPIRKSQHIDEAILCLSRSKLSTIAAVKGPFQKRDPILKRINTTGELVHYRDDAQFDAKEPFYIYNAALYGAKREYFVREKRFTSDKQVPFIMDHAHSTDVDELIDFEIAEALLSAITKGKI